jgi:hypothetical protein
MATKKNTERIVVLRSRDSGVWIGVFVSQSGRDVTLSQGRKIWRWRGANTTSELALRGCSKEYSRVAEPVNVTVNDCCEILESNPVALKAVSECGWPQ